jgi:hypothetical protein
MNWPTLTRTKEPSHSAAIAEVLRRLTANAPPGTLDPCDWNKHGDSCLRLAFMTSGRRSFAATTGLSTTSEYVRRFGAFRALVEQWCSRGFREEAVPARRVPEPSHPHPRDRARLPRKQAGTQRRKQTGVDRPSPTRWSCPATVRPAQPGGQAHVQSAAPRAWSTSRRQGSPSPHRWREVSRRRRRPLRESSFWWG